MYKVPLANGPANDISNVFLIDPFVFYNGNASNSSLKHLVRVSPGISA